MNVSNADLGIRMEFLKMVEYKESHQFFYLNIYAYICLFFSYLVPLLVEESY